VISTSPANRRYGAAIHESLRKDAPDLAERVEDESLSLAAAHGRIRQGYEGCPTR
jgi:hypothetical protein